MVAFLRTGKKPMGRPQIAADWLGTDPAVHDLTLRVGRLIALQAMLAESHPGGGVQVLSLEAGTLTLAAANAAEAAKLRQREPSLVAALRRRGAAVERLRIRTTRNVDPNPSASLGPARSPIPPAALAELGQLGAQLAPGALQQALDRLVAKRRLAEG